MSANKVRVTKTHDDKNVFHCYGITLLKAEHSLLMQLTSEGYEPSLHGTKCWDSAFVMMDYFEDCPPEKGLNVLEIGSGWGPLGIYLAKNHAANVLAMDADSAVFPFLKAQAEENGVVIETLNARFEDIAAEQLAPIDLIIGTDVCFWDEMVNPLYHLIAEAKNVQCPTIMIADPGRSPFYALHEKCLEKWGDAVELHEWQSDYLQNIKDEENHPNKSADIIVISA